MTYTKKGTSATFKYTPPATREPDNKKETITITLTPSRDVITLTAADIEVTGDHNKKYDGNTTVTDTAPTIAVRSGSAYTGKPVTLSASFAYDNAAAGTTAMTASNIATAANGDGTDNTAYYQIDSAVKTIAHTVTTGIEKADSTATTAEATGVKTDEASALQALKDAAVKVTAAGFTGAQDLGKKVSEVITGLTDAQLTGLIETALKNDGYKTDAPATIADVSVEASTASTSLTATQKIGGKVKLDNVPAGATVAVKSGEVLPTGIELSGTDLTIGSTASTTTSTVKLTVTPAGGSPAPYDLEIAITVQAAPAAVETADYKAAAGKSIDVTIGKANLQDVSGVNFAIAGKVDLVVTMKFKSNTPTGGGSTGFGVSFDSKGYGSVSEAYIETDENGKIVSLPKVTNVVKGAVFVGWSVNGQKPVINVDTFTATNDVTLKAVYEGYMIGDEKNKINATANVTRAELAKMLMISSGKFNPEKTYSTDKFSDVGSGQWFAKYVACAEAEGIINGYPDGTFKPNAPVTREEAAKMIALTFGVDVREGATVDELTDFAKLGKWAKDYVAALYGTGAIDGYPDHTYRGGTKIQRDASAKMINTFLGLDDEAKEAIVADSSIKANFADMVSTGNWAYADLVFASLNVPSTYYSEEIVVPTRGE